MPELGPPNNRLVKATEFDEVQLNRIIKQLFGEVKDQSGDSSPAGRFGNLHVKMQRRAQHFHNTEEADPLLPPPYDQGPRYQTDMIRQKHVELLARQLENKPTITVKTSSSLETKKSRADDVEQHLNQIWFGVQEREEIDICRGLFTGINIYGYGVLHWQMATKIIPNIPEYEEADEESLPVGRDRNRFRPEPEENGAYKETDESLQERTTLMRADAGAPWYIDFIHPGQVAFVRDTRNISSGFALFAVRRKIPILDYNEKLYDNDKAVVSLYQADPRIHIYEEADAPARWTPSGQDLADYGKVAYVVEVWTRQGVYEMVSSAADGTFRLVKAFKHPYGSPPFALALAHRNLEADPSLMYEPLMTGMFRLKPYYDRARALGDIIAEMIALPVWYMKSADGKMVLKDGKPLLLSRQSMAAQILPNGVTLEKIDFQLNPAVNDWIAKLGTELEEAAPSTGTAEVSASTEPWAIRLQMQAASIEIADSVRNVATAIQSCVRNIAFVMSLPEGKGGFEESVPSHPRNREGVVDYSRVLNIEPSEYQDIQIDVNINPHSSAERIAMEQHGLAMLENPMSILTLREFAEVYSGKPDAKRALAEKDAETIWLQRIKPTVVEQELAKEYADFIVLGVGGAFVGMGGEEVPPEEVLARNGVQPQQMPPEVPNSTVGNGAGQGTGPMPMAMPPLSPLEAPGTVALPGVQT